MSSPTPLTSPNLSLILTSLLPPSFPLPAHCLSSALKTRQLYLPPNADDLYDDAWICQRPEQGPDSTSTPNLDSGADAREGSGDGLKVGKITSKLIQLEHTLRESSAHENARDLVQGEGGPIIDYAKLSGSVEYSVRDEETVLGRVVIRPSRSQSGSASASASTSVGEGVEVIVIYEPSPEDATNCPWKLFDTSLSSSTSASSSTGWYPSLPAAQSAAGNIPNSFDPRQSQAFGQSSTPGGADDGEATVGEGDFWAGYDSPDEDEDDNEKQGAKIPSTSQSQPQSQSQPCHSTQPQSSHSTQPPSALNLSLPRHPTPPTSTLMGEEDPYWSAYSSVEDGLRASNPPSRGVSRFTTPLYHQQYGYGHIGVDNSNGSGVGVGAGKSGGSGSRKSSYFGVGGMGGAGGSGSVSGRGGGGDGGEYWGTGGETPVGWSPPVQQSQLPPIHSHSHPYSHQTESGENAIDLTRDDITPPTATAPAPADASALPPTGPRAVELRAALEGLADGNGGDVNKNKALPIPPQAPSAGDNSNNVNINGATTQSSAVGAATEKDNDVAGRKEALRMALRGLRGMWVAGGGGGEEEWRGVLREFI